jgi:hypothetical protein
MRGNDIVVSGNPRGVFLEGTLLDSSLPGTIMEMDPNTAFIGGEPGRIASAPGTAGEAVLMAVLINDNLDGLPATSGQATGTRCRLYVPISGEDCNVLVGEASGTGVSVTQGDRLMIAATGGQIVEATSTNGQWIAMETIHNTGAALTWCRRI